MTWPITYRDVLDAEKRIRRYLPPTPLRNYPPIDNYTNAKVWVKHENHHPTNAFKVRNGLASLTGLGFESIKNGVVAATSGNHGLGVAWAARKLGVTATICVANGTNPEKVDAIRMFGARVIEQGNDYDQAVQVMEQLSTEHGYVAIHSTNNPFASAGAGTMTLEIIRDLDARQETLDAMVIAIGGGSQAVGAMTVLRELKRDIPVFGVQAAGAPTLSQAWKAKTPLSGKTPVTIAEGIATRETYEVTFGALCEGLTDFITVSEKEIRDAMRFMIQATHNLVEPAGAVGVAGVCRLRCQLQGKTVAVILSGGNVDLQTLYEVIKP